MRKSVIAIIVIVLVVLYMSVFVVKEGERGITLRFGKVLRDDENKPLVYAPPALQDPVYRIGEDAGCAYSDHGQPG